MTPADPQLLTPALIRRTLTYRWVCLGLLFVSGLLAFFTRLAPAVAIPDLREAFVLNAAELGLLTSLYLWPFALMQPVAGVLTDAFGSRRTVTAFLVVAGVGQVLFASAPTFLVALIGRALTGLGASILYVGAAKIMAQWFRSREFGTLTGAWTSVANLGGLTAAAPLMALITLAGWRLSLGGVGARHAGDGGPHIYLRPRQPLGAGATLARRHRWSAAASGSQPVDAAWARAFSWYCANQIPGCLGAMPSCSSAR